MRPCSEIRPSSFLLLLLDQVPICVAQVHHLPLSPHQVCLIIVRIQDRSLPGLHPAAPPAPGEQEVKEDERRGGERASSVEDAHQEHQS